MNHHQLSQKHFGIILKGLREPRAYDPSDFSFPYCEYLEKMLEKKWQKEDLYAAYASTEQIDAAIGAANPIVNVEDYPIEKLSASMHNLTMGERLQKIGHGAVAEGKEIPAMELQQELRNLEDGLDPDVPTADRINLDEVDELIPIGWEAFDNCIGGIANGITIVNASTGTGKTFMTGKIVNEYLHTHPDKFAYIFANELNWKQQWKRYVTMYPTIQEVADRIYIASKFRDTESIRSQAYRKNADLVIIDTLQYSVKGSPSADSVASAMKDCVAMAAGDAKKVIVVTQPNRNGKAKVENGEWLGLYDAEWSGETENAASLYLTLQYVSSTLDMQSKSPYPLHDDAYYIITHKYRAEIPRNQYNPTGKLGALILTEHKKNENGQTILWESEPKTMRLWEKRGGDGYPNA